MTARKWIIKHHRRVNHSLISNLKSWISKRHVNPRDLWNLPGSTLLGPVNIFLLFDTAYRLALSFTSCLHCVIDVQMFGIKNVMHAVLITLAMVTSKLLSKILVLILVTSRCFASSKRWWTDNCNSQFVAHYNSSRPLIVAFTPIKQCILIMYLYKYDYIYLYD